MVLQSIPVMRTHILLQIADDVSSDDDFMAELEELGKSSSRSCSPATIRGNKGML